jgi:subtilisin family serine protease
MIKKHLQILFILLVLTCSAAFAGDLNGKFKMPTGVEYIPNSFIIKIKPQYRASCDLNDVNLPELKTVLHSLHFTGIKKKFPHQQPPLPKQTNKHGVPFADLSLIYEVNYTGSIDMEAAINRVLMTGLLEYAVPRYIDKISYRPSDPDTNNNRNWHLKRIRAYQAWDITRGDTSVVVAIIDSGVDWDHPDLFTNIAFNYNDPIDGIDNDNDGYVDNFRGWDFVGPTFDPNYPGDNNVMVTSQQNSHGTHVAGTACAATDNGIGIAGSGFRCRFMPIKCGTDGGGQSIFFGYEAIEYAARMNASVINCSWGGGGASPFAQDVLTYAAVNKNALIVAAAGNDNSSGEHYPSGYRYALSVAATGQTDQKANFSNYNYKIDVSAPGVQIYATRFNDAYMNMSGTSMASPVVAGAAGIVRSRFPNYSPEQVIQRIRVTADDIYDVNTNTILQGRLGKGRLNLLRAVTEETPGIKSQNITITDFDDDYFQVGDTLYIWGTFINYLDASSPALTARLSTGSPFITVVNATATYNLGVIQTNLTKSTQDAPFKAVINSNAPPDLTVAFRINYQDVEYNDFEYFETAVNTTYINISRNNIATTITSRGRIGWNTDGQTGGVGLGFAHKGRQTAYEIGLMSGRAVNRIASSTRGAQGSAFSDHYRYISVVREITPPVLATNEWHVLMNDQGAGALASNVRIRQRVLAWDTPADSNYIIVQLSITNAGNNTIENYHVGYYADFDISPNGQRDFARYNAPRRLGFVQDPSDNGYFAGIAVLGTVPGVHYTAIDNDGEGGSPFGVYDGYTNAEKFQSISSGLLDTIAGNSNPLGKDVSLAIGAGPYTIPSGDSISVAFLFAAGPDLFTILQAADDGIINYDTIEPVITATQRLSNSAEQKAWIYPNPSKDGSFYVGSTMMQGIRVEAFDLLGRSAALLHGRGDGYYQIANAKEGIYMIKLTYDGKSEYHRLLIKH